MSFLEGTSPLLVSSPGCGVHSGAQFLHSDPVYLALVEACLAHGRDTPNLLAAVLAHAPHHPRGHGAKAFMLTMLARAELIPVAKACAQQAVILAEGFSKAEQSFARASVQAAHGDWWRAAETLESVSRLDGSDSLAAKFSHGLRFMLGDKPGMLRTSQQVLTQLPHDHPHRGYLMGCHAFALEENGFYAQAEAIGREAVRLQPLDAWGLHAVSHVHEMTGRCDDGIRWIETHEALARQCNNFGGHLFWHLALFQLEKGAIDAVFALYDREIRAEKTDDFRDIANAASLLSRLELEGYSVGDRWEELADKAEARLKDRALIFADLHYMLALVGAGRADKAAALALSMRATPAAHVAQDRVAMRTGAGMAEGILHLAQGMPQKAFHAFDGARAGASAMGGSDAQRDVFDQLMLESALRGGDGHRAAHLLNDRLAGRYGHNRFAQDRLAKISRKMSKSSGALAVLASLTRGHRAAEAGH